MTSISASGLFILSSILSTPLLPHYSRAVSFFMVVGMLISIQSIISIGVPEFPRSVGL
ncbi:MAG: hypothetical protein ACO2O0_01125 [Desulfurococcales archaeon]|nr:hypothetical protein [Desulfurococcales archaeon]